MIDSYKLKVSSYFFFTITCENVSVNYVPCIFFCLNYGMQRFVLWESIVFNFDRTMIDTLYGYYNNVVKICATALSLDVTMFTTTPLDIVRFAIILLDVTKRKELLCGIKVNKRMYWFSIFYSNVIFWCTWRRKTFLYVIYEWSYLSILALHPLTWKVMWLQSI